MIYSVTWRTFKNGQPYIIDIDAEDPKALDVACSMAVALCESNRFDVAVHAHGSPIDPESIATAATREVRVTAMPHIEEVGA